VVLEAEGAHEGAGFGERAPGSALELRSTLSGSGIGSALDTEEHVLELLGVELADEAGAAGADPGDGL
jgi:hypothetical protein